MDSWLLRGVFDHWPETVYTLIDTPFWWRRRPLSARPCFCSPVCFRIMFPSFLCFPFAIKVTLVLANGVYRLAAYGRR